MLRSRGGDCITLVVVLSFLLAGFGGLGFDLFGGFGRGFVVDFLLTLLLHTES